MTDLDKEGLIDLTQFKMEELFLDKDPILEKVGQRIANELDDPDGVISAFQSFPSPPGE